MALRVTLMLMDGAVAVGVFLLVADLRYSDGTTWNLWRALGMDSLTAALVFAAIWVSVMWASGIYRQDIRWRVWTEIQDLIRATALFVAIVLSALFIFKQTDVSRLFLALLFIVQPSATLLMRLLVRAAFDAVRKAGRDPRHMLVAGTGAFAQDFADRVEAHPSLGLRVIGHLRAPGEDEPVVTRPVLGTIDQIEEIFHSTVVDEVAVCLAAAAHRYLEPITGVAAGEGKTVRVAVDPTEEILPGSSQEEFDGFLVRSVVNDVQRDVGLIVKRAIDIVGSTIGLVVLSPVLLATAIAIRLDDGGPILFRQTRIGLHGRPFTIYKFRTMVVDAEARLAEVMHLNERTGAAFKVRDDPRITRLGRFLRRTSLDELPQFWNVLLGTMSLVGPRPPLPEEVAEYDIWHRRRLSMKPGVTGLWQVEARHEPDFDRWVEHDLLYIDGWSIWLDLKILARTLPALLAHGGH
jgi:exopolysaccharide biosynthesis polyprenyl glycosylphosphotransferase